MREKHAASEITDRPAAKKAAPLPKDFTKFGKIEVNSNNGEE